MRLRAATAVIALLGALPLGARGQSTEALAQACTSANPGLASRCAEAAVAARSLMGQTGLLFGLGSSVPGAPSTLGRRIGSTPRVALSTRGGGLQLKLPDLTDQESDPARQASGFAPTLHGSFALGVFDGFQLMPTVGGFLSLDVLGQTSMVFLPVGDGFDGNLGSLSFGARVGILRESFTLPGVTLSVSRHLGGTVRFGDVSAADPSQVEVDASTTSYRLTVGKDLFAVGLLGGVGWDSYGGDVTMSLTDVGANVRRTTGRLEASRRLYYAGAALNFLVLQLSAELGWADGFDPLTGYAGAPFDPRKGALFASLAARLTI